MNNPEYVIEVAVYTVKEEFVSQMPAIREDFRKALNDFAGFLSLDSMSPMDENRTFADIAKWDTMESAQAVAKAFESGDERFLPLMETVEDMKFMGNFQP